MVIRVPALQDLAGCSWSGLRKGVEHETNDLSAYRCQVGNLDSMARKQAYVHRVARLVEGVWISEKSS